MSIPVANLYYLYCYAWRRFSAAADCRVFDDHAPQSTADLWALVLAEAFTRQVRRGLDHGYRVHHGRLNLPRGRMHPLQSAVSGALAVGQLECSWDEFVPDTDPNRIIKYTMRRLANCREVAPQYAHRLRRLVQMLPRVADLTPTRREVRSVQLHRNNASYGLMLDVCRHVLDFLMPAEGDGTSTFRDPRRDDRHMARVFEDFLMAWYQRHADPEEFSWIGRRELAWPARPLGDPEDLRFLPSMITDITLRGPDRVLIIDAKYYHHLLVARREDAAPKVISGHLYQLHAYLSAWATHYPDGPIPEGMLLYPTVQDHVNLKLEIHGFPVRVASVNLDQAWPKIAAQLTSLIEPLADPTSTHGLFLAGCSMGSG